MLVCVVFVVVLVSYGCWVFGDGCWFVFVGVSVSVSVSGVGCCGVGCLGDVCYVSVSVRFRCSVFGCVSVSVVLVLV